MRFLLAVLFVLIGASSAFAKNAKLEWTEIVGAEGYEIEFVPEKGVKQTHRAKSASWKGDLPEGLYRYRIRGADRFKRPGTWSDALTLLLMPAPVDLDSPSSGTQLAYFGGSPQIILKWKPRDGVHVYRVRVWQGAQLVRDQKVASTSLALDGMKDGAFRWQVTGWFEARPKRWETEEGDVWKFEQTRKKLEAPSLEFPRGLVATPKSGKLKLVWSPVEGASEYEVRLWRTDGRAVPHAREPATTADRGQLLFRSKERTLVVPVNGDGTYRWQVRALASMQPGQPEVGGPVAVENFGLSQHALYSEGSGYVALSTMLAPYTYTYVSPSSGGTGSAGALSVVGRLSGEYWFSGLWGMGGAAELNMFRIASRSHLAKVFEINGKMRINLGKDKWGWIIQPKIGLEKRDYFSIGRADIIDPSRPTNYASVVGPAVGFDVRKQIWDRFSLSMKINYFVPLTVIDSVASSPISVSSNWASVRNVSLGLQGAYWLGGKFAVAAGGYMEFRSLAYTGTFSPAGQPEEVYMDGAFFFASFIYSFGS